MRASGAVPTAAIVPDSRLHFENQPTFAIFSGHRSFVFHMLVFHVANTGEHPMQIHGVTTQTIQPGQGMALAIPGNITVEARALPDAGPISGWFEVRHVEAPRAPAPN